MSLVHVIFKQPALRVLLVTLVTFHKVLGGVHVSYVVLELLKGLAAMGTCLLHVEVDCPVMSGAVTSLPEPLRTKSQEVQIDGTTFLPGHTGGSERETTLV